MNPNHTRFKLIKSSHNTDLSLDSDDLEDSFLFNKSTFSNPPVARPPYCCVANLRNLEQTKNFFVTVSA